MRSIRNPRLERGEVRIEDIALDHKCRDDLIAILIGIQYLYLQEDLRERLFALLDKQRFPIKFKLSGPAANLGARHGPAGIVRFGGTAVLFRRLPGR